MSLYHVDADDIPQLSLTGNCIVLDLDQTLIATQDDKESLGKLGILSKPELMPLRSRTYHITIEDLERPGIGTKYEFWGITRPHIKEFLLFCFSYFKIVAVWSAGKRPYVEAIVDYIFKDIRSPHVVFTHDDLDYDSEGNFFKPLIKMIESDPVLRRNMSLQNTLALDDNDKTYVKNVGNGILIPAYDSSSDENDMMEDDPSLLQVKYWLLQPEVINAKDVTTLDKSMIFKTSLETYRNKLQSASGYKYPKRKQYN